MAREPLTITVDPESELGRALAEPDDAPIILVRNGARFRVTRDPDDPWANYDPEKVREGLRKFAGICSREEEADRIKEGIYRGREEGTRPHRSAVRYLVDSDWLIDATAGRPAAQQYLAQLSADGLAVSIIAVAEVYEGAFGTADPEASWRAYVSS